MNVLNRVTLQTLKKNKIRTAVTVIGVILSAAMITAVTSLITSMQNYMVEYEIAHGGNWHVELDSLSDEDAARLESDSRVERLDWIQNMGFAKLAGSSNDWRPYLKVLGFSEGAMETLPVRMTLGRLPENGSEIVISDYVLNIGKVDLELGQEITLGLGQRRDADGEILKLRSSFQEGESLEVLENRTYTVVGFCENPSYDASDSPGYGAITWADAGAFSEKSSLSYYLRLESPKDAYTVLSDYGKSGMDNQNLLLYLNVSAHSGFYRVLYGMGTILMILILIGSVSLIYNAFSISISERTRQFGILSSVGATKKQLASSVRFEAMAVGILGIPLGIGSGLVGAWITLMLLSDKFSYLAGGGTMHLSVTWLGLVTAFLIACLALFLSAWAPARRASRMSAMDAIRQSQDILVRPQRRQTGRLAYRLFGLPGLLAAKNFKRNRRSYRSTVISLFLSIVLFLSASSFVQYLGAGVRGGTGTSNYDLEYYAQKSDSLEVIYEKLKAVPGVKESSWYQAGYYNVWLDRAALDTGLAERLDENNAWDPEAEDSETAEKNRAHWNLRTVFIEDEPFERYLKELGLNTADYLDQAHPQAVAVNRYRYYDPNQDAYRTFQVLGGSAPLDASFQVERFSKKGDKLGEMEWTLPIGAFTAVTPLGINASDYTGTIILLYPASLLDVVTPEVLTDTLSDPVMQFTAEDPENVYQEMNRILKEQLAKGSLYNQAEREKSTRDMLEIIHVFSYGFIVLISLIAVANVFHTISTNLYLRRREFAMLESVGMTERGLRRMMYYECLCYGGKSLLYGLPIAFGINYLLFRSMDSGVEIGFQVPWGSLAVSVGSVFLVVIATMLYAMSKLKKESTVDVLKQENG